MNDPAYPPSSAVIKSTSLAELWDDFSKVPVIERSWPTAENLSALHALKSIDKKRADDLTSRVEFGLSFSNLPIFAVAGPKNAGKSSFISAFLSPAGRERIPRGLKSTLGTQRFTVWLPQSWESDADLLEHISNTLADVFGHAAEPLSYIAEEAIHQQTLTHAIEKPLIAFDTSLEEQNFAFIDCPDIDSAAGNTPENNARLRMLTKAGEICVGVMLVVERSKIQVDLIPVIERHLPQCTQVYAINMVRDEVPHEVLKDWVQEYERNPEHCYVAFDYEVGGYRERTPSIDPNLVSNAVNTRKLPFFFEVSPEPEMNLPNAVTFDRSIVKIGARFDPDTLRQKRQQEQLTEIKTNLENSVGYIEAETVECADAVGRAATLLFRACKDMLTHDGQAVITPDLKSLENIADSLKRTAPKDFKPWIWMFGGGFRLLKKAIEKKDEIKKWLRGRKGHLEKVQIDSLAPDNLCESLAGWSAACGLARVAESWKEDAIDVFNRFNREHKTTLAAAEWDVLTKQMWDHAPKWKQRMAVVLGMVAGLLAIASALLDFLGGHGLFTLTYAKLISLLGIGGNIVGPGMVVQEREALIKKLTLQNVSNFFAITADRVGVPRNVPRSFENEFPQPIVVEKPNRDAYGLVDRHWQLARPISKNVNSLRSAINLFKP